MGEIRSLHGHDIEPGEVNEAAVELLTELLDRAKAGDVVGVQVTINYGDEAVGWTYAGRHWGTKTIGAVYSMLSELDRSINGVAE